MNIFSFLDNPNYQRQFEISPKFIRKWKNMDDLILIIFHLVLMNSYVYCELFGQYTYLYLSYYELIVNKIIIISQIKKNKIIKFCCIPIHHYTIFIPPNNISQILSTFFTCINCKSPNFQILIISRAILQNYHFNVFENSIMTYNNCILVLLLWAYLTNHPKRINTSFHTLLCSL
jgi:hypothetical protein